MTYHPNGKSTSSDPFHTDSWLDFNMYESHIYPTYIHTQTPIEYRRTNPAKPVVNGEALYFGYDRFEKFPDTDRPYRSQAYWTMLLGGAGHTYGDRYLWCFEKKDDPTSCQSEENQDWFDYLDSNGAVWHAYWKDFFTSIEWWKLVPDQTIIAAGKGSNLNLKVVARSTDSDLIVVYFPKNRPATIDLNKLTSGSTVSGSWWNPVNKVVAPAGEFSNLGLKRFIPPSGWEDAILLLRSK